MADGPCTGDQVSNVIEKTTVKDYDNAIACENNDRVNAVACEKVNTYYMGGVSDKLFDKLCDDGPKHEGYLAMPCSPTTEDDCRKKRCVDRYDSSESSDSGVAVLSCTDCSGSSTASSDITDPGSPYSTGSTHSEDSGSQPAKMPPTQSAHHTPWPWSTEDSPPVKRPSQEKTAFPKRLKTDEVDARKKSPACLSNLHNSNAPSQPSVVVHKPCVDVTSLSDKVVNNKSKSINKKPPEVNPKMQQGKITEYFKTQMKSNGLKKELSNIAAVKTTQSDKNNTNKLVTLIEPNKQINAMLKNQTLRKIDARNVNPAVRKVVQDVKARKLSPVTVPRKILPAPSKITEKTIIPNPMQSFAPTVTLTAVSFPPNLTYIHTKAPKPPDNIFVQQFATISNDKLNVNGIPIVNRTCVLQPIPKLTAINNFNCVKLNGTVVPIVKLNTMPSRINGSNVAVSVETAVPTVLATKPKIDKTPTIIASSTTTVSSKQISTLQASVSPPKSRTEDQLPSQPDSDSGISTKDVLEISVSQSVSVESQKSPILSQPKTIRFPAKQQEKSEKEHRAHSNDKIHCRWDNCHAHFDTSGALLEHLQVKHVISQATQEQYVCLWLGCKVHGRTSCSRSWLERHVLAHAGTKPFRCIVDGCGMRFNSQVSLERHVNNHFNTEGSQSGSSKKSVENGSVKLFRRNGKRLRFRRQPWSARMFDFIDTGIMEGLQHRLLTMTEKRTLGQIEGAPGDTISLQSQVLARRIEADGKTKVLVRWHPTDVVLDEWVNVGDLSKTKTVTIPSLEPSAKDALRPALFETKTEQPVRQKHRRKPIPKAAT